MRAVLRVVGPWFCIIMLVLVTSATSYWFGRQTAQTEACHARHTFEVGHDKLVNLFDTLGKHELDLNPQQYSADEVQRRRDVLTKFVHTARVPIETC